MTTEVRPCVECKARLMAALQDGEGTGAVDFVHAECCDAAFDVLATVLTGACPRCGNPLVRGHHRSCAGVQS